MTLPPFGPIRYGGPKPGAAVIDHHEDDEAPSWAAIEEYAPAAPEAEAPVVEPESEPGPEPMAAAPEVAEPEPVVAESMAADEETPVEHAYEEREAPAWLDAAAAEPVAHQTPQELPWIAASEPEPEAISEPEPEAIPEPDVAPEPEVTAFRPVLPFTGPNDPTPIMNRVVERRTAEFSTEPHRMTPMRVTPLRPAAVPAPSPVIGEGNARAVAAALELIAARVRRGELIVPGQMPKNDDPPALAAALAATLSALLGVSQ